MRLLIYSHYFAPSVGGVESIVLSLARGLSELSSPPAGNAAGGEFDVTVVTHTAAKEFDDHALPFSVVRQPRLPTLRRLIRNSDVVHLAGPALAPMTLAWLSRRPFVIEHHTYQAVCPNGLLIHQPDRAICPNHFLRREYDQCRLCLSAEFGGFSSVKMLLQMAPRYFLARRASANIAVSGHVLERCALPRSSTVYHGVEDPLAGVLPGAAVQQPAREQGKSEIVFAYVGRLVPEKGLPVLLEAARILSQAGRSFRLLLVGDGLQRAALEAVIRRDGLDSRVVITGFLGGLALSERLNEAQVVVMPSVWEETAGLAAIDQMMRGRLVIASGLGGLGEVVDAAAIKVPPNDAHALAAAMERILLDPSLLSLYGARARERALHLFQRERMIAEHARIYRQLARRRAAHP